MIPYSCSLNRDRCLVVLPTYGERDNIATMVSVVLSSARFVDVLVVDDNSPDGTAEVVRAIASAHARVSLLIRPTKLGLGSAYLAGFKRGLARGYGFVCTMDADCSHDPAAILGMRGRLVTNGADLVIGSRYVMGGSIENWSLARRINSRVANYLAGRLLRLSVCDCTSGYRMYSATLLRRMRLTSLSATGYFGLVELLCKARAAGGRVVEHPIAFRNRDHGISKLTLREILSSVGGLLALSAIGHFLHWSTNLIGARNRGLR